jgi:long-chain fatty acid transport protein
MTGSRAPTSGAIVLLMGAGIAACAGAPAFAGGFSVREQSAYYLGTSFAGSASGGDISSVFWNSAATAALPGCNSSSNFTAVFGSADETATGGLFATPVAPASTDVARSAVVPSSYATCQLSDKLFAGLAINAPYGLVTKPDNTAWAGSPIAVTSKLFSVNINPTLAYRLSPELTVGAGIQVEYFSLRLTHSAFNTLLGPLTGARVYDADDWGFGATAGILWQPSRATSIGLGYRSAVDLDVSGQYTTTAAALTGPALSTKAKGEITLPDEVTLSARQALGPRLALLGTVEWQNWSRVQNVTATSAGCPGGVCETLNLNYRDGWLYSVGLEYAYSPALLLRTGIGYETSPITDSTRNIILPDSNRIHVSVGASYQLSDRLTADIGYSHLFFQDQSFCIASPAANGGSSHCNAATPPGAVLLTGKADVSTDLLGVGLKYKF